jgi:hypothetical protein
MDEIDVRKTIESELEKRKTKEKDFGVRLKY